MNAWRPYQWNGHVARMIAPAITGGAEGKVCEQDVWMVEFWGTCPKNLNMLRDDRYAMAFSSRINYYLSNWCLNKTFVCWNVISLTHWALDKMAENFHMTFSNGFFCNENVSTSIKILLRFVPKGPINNTPALVQIMVWRRPGAKPLSEPMMASLLTHMRHPASVS